MTERQKRIMKREGKNIDKITRLPKLLLKQMIDEDVTMEEAKIIARNLVCILEESEEHRPDVLLSEAVRAQ